MGKRIILSLLIGVLAAGILLGIYFGLLTVLSGWSYAWAQFAKFGYFVVTLAVGFGIQVALFTISNIRLRKRICLRG